MIITGKHLHRGSPYRPMQHVNRLVVHCSATDERDFGAADIDRWHRAQSWLCIGYHYVIKRDGTIERGRPEDMPGAHASGYNADSIGICLIGGVDGKTKRPADNFAPEQKAALRELLNSLLDRYPDAEILGHRDLPEVAKACPSFDVREWWNQSTI